MRRLAAVLVAVVGAGCAASGAAVAGAAVNTAIAATAAGVNRANGGCYSPCADGTECVPATGLCEPLPCRGRCQFDERCEPLPVEHCAPGAAVRLKVDVEPLPAERVTPQ